MGAARYVQIITGMPVADPTGGFKCFRRATLEAIDLANGQLLAGMLEQDAAKLLQRPWKSADDLARWVYQAGLSRPPTAAELALARETLGATPPTPQRVQDFLWALTMLPEFQLVR